MFIGSIVTIESCIFSDCIHAVINLCIRVESKKNNVDTTRREVQREIVIFFTSGILKNRIQKKLSKPELIPLQINRYLLTWQHIPFQQFYCQSVFDFFLDNAFQWTSAKLWIKTHRG